MNFVFNMSFPVSHTLQEYGFSPVWTLVWSIREEKLGRYSVQLEFGLDALAQNQTQKLQFYLAKL